MLKRFMLLLAIAVAVIALSSGIAFANFGPHGGYTADTDECAGCHRAHTSFSEVTWDDQYDNTHSALLISQATSMSEFCYACHGDGTPGASTNVVAGVFDSGPSGADGVAIGDTVGDVLIRYETDSSFDATLNGGGFVRMPNGDGYDLASSMHNMDVGTLTDPMWGAGDVVPTSANLTCTDCHDPHGSSNYRLLKDTVNGHAVGGYDSSDIPDPFVISNETGYPNALTSQVGWLKHEEGQTQMLAYKPNYTEPEYAFRGVTGEARSMSVWCSACHERYFSKTDTAWASSPFASSFSTDTYSYGEYEQFVVESTTYTVGAQTRHRHPVNVTMAAGRGSARALETEVLTDSLLPLEVAPANLGVETWDWGYDDFMGCLTCHRAHGTSSVMTGWSEAELQTSTGVTWYPVLLAQDAGTSGVNPNFTSALLRTNDRGVCERCHNK